MFESSNLSVAHKQQIHSGLSKAQIPTIRKTASYFKKPSTEPSLKAKASAPGMCATTSPRMSRCLSPSTLWECLGKTRFLEKIQSGFELRACTEIWTWRLVCKGVCFCGDL